MNPSWNTCSYCNESDSETTFLKCTECNSLIHLDCLRNELYMPDHLLGDVFYKYICTKCSCTAAVQMKREKLSWLTILVITLYNLQMLQDRVSRQGYFHWKFHIANFIDKNWNIFFGRNTKKKRSWRGTVSGTLSHYSPTFFRTGSEILNESGWWCLAQTGTPQQMIQQHTNFMQESKKSGSLLDDSEPMLQDSVTPVEMPSMSSFLPQDVLSFTDDKESLSSRSGLDLDILSFTDSESLDVNVDINVDECDDHIIGGDLSNDFSIFDGSFSYPGAYSYIEVGSEVVLSGEKKDGSDSDIEPEPKSLFTPRSQEAGGVRWPWENTQDSAQCFKTDPPSEYEEVELLSRLSRCIERSKRDRPDADIPSCVRRLNRRLKIRQEQRHRRLRLHDRELRRLCGIESENEEGGILRMLDRYQNVSWAALQHEPESTKQQPFMLRLLGHVEPACFVSSYTDRLLKPFIRRDYETKPLWLCLMEEVREAANKNNLNWRPPTRHPIDFSYVRPHHIPAINSLCELFFWPGIDMTESLHYPDFSCVALYRKLVVGFAFMLPVSYTETYISFLFTRPEWRRANIASFMLYHLIQTCMGKDVTLHVSATNPALILYQKFGFKVEEFVQDFYDKYLPPNSRECKHALFLRLSR